jgi:DUF4097 and DUF4098 domain-containing protein YvlB
MPEFPTTDPITVDVRITAGSVDLFAEPRESALVEVEPYDGGDPAQEAAARTRVDLAGDTLVIAAPDPNGWLLRRSPRLRVTVRVPTGSTGRLRVVTADVTCHGEWAQVKLGSAAGDIYLEQITGDLTVNTASGDVRAVQVGGRLTVKTASGDVSAQRVAGPVDVKTASGDVQVDDAGADANLTTASGNATIGVARHGTVRTTTVAGDVSVGVARGTGVWLDLNTLSGKTRSDLTVADGGTGPPSHDLTILVRTVSGDIEVHRGALPTHAA